MSSSRLPGKVMLPILGAPMISRQIERISRARLIEKLVVATSEESSDDVLAAFCEGSGFRVHRGPLVNALSRFTGALARFGPARHVVRLTADCPLTDWAVIDGAIQLHLDGGHEYTSNAMQRTFPIGLDVEVMTAQTLERLARTSATDFQREHVTQLIYDRPGDYACGYYLQERDESRRRWTVDTPVDFAMVQAVYAELYPSNPAFATQDIRDLLARRPDIVAINGA
jgi:spore coat polysaccharide biosynthesis protein SpsF